MTVLEDDAARLEVGGRTYQMSRVPSASGARYEAAGDPRTSFWSKGENATLVIGGRAFPECVPPGAAAEEPFVATGFEPGWRLEIHGDRLDLTTDYGERRFAVADARRSPLPDGRRYSGAADGHAVAVSVRDTLCRDAATGQPHPASVDVDVDGTLLHGCGGDPATLLRGALWTVQSVAGAPLTSAQPLRLDFAEGGRLELTTECGAIPGQWAVTGEGLSVTGLAAVEGACGEPARAQVERLRDLLHGVRRFGLDAQGVLELESEDGSRISAERVGPPVGRSGRGPARRVVDPKGFEPSTSALRRQRSPS